MTATQDSKLEESTPKIIAESPNTDDSASTPGEATPATTEAESVTTTAEAETSEKSAEAGKSTETEPEHKQHVSCCCCCPKRNGSSDDKTAEDKDGKKEDKKDEKKDDKDLTDEEKAAKEKEEEEEKNAPTQLSVKHLDFRPDDDGNLDYSEPKNRRPKADVDKWRKWALCEVRNFDYENEYQDTRLEINSVPLKDVLKRVIGDNYPGVSFSTALVELVFPLNCLYHYLDELKEESEKVEGEEKEHLDFLLEYVNEQMKDTIRDVKNLVSDGYVTYELLWVIFKPGQLMYAEVGKQHRAFKIRRHSYIDARHCPRFEIEASYIDFDGKDFGKVELDLFIRKFSGTKKISDLNIVPLDLHPDRDDLRSKLLTRGRKFEGLRGMQYCQYSGLSRGPQTPAGGYIMVSVNGPAMIDCKTFEMINPERRMAFSHSVESTDEDEPELAYFGHETERKTYLSDTQCILANCTVRGFAFVEKQWVDFYVDQITEPYWNDQAFDQLVLPEKHKRIVRALVESHARDGAQFDDIIQGKGKGLVSVLHGPPGVGKTLTAEAVSHVIHRPLYVVTSGELGTHSSALEENLSRILNVASAWRCCLLIDEADVFLEKREAMQIDRNALVSVFLRLLEYYQGILFLTTNRLTTFDEAFQSRIHVALKYQSLDEQSRRKIWRNFLQKVDKIKISEKDYNKLAEYNLNGREIKNCIRTAGALADAAEEGKPLGLEDLLTVLKLQKEFELEMRGESVDTLHSLYS